MDTPNTVNYLVAGYVVFSVIFTVYLVSLFLRWHNLQKTHQSLQELQKK